MASKGSYNLTASFDSGLISDRSFIHIASALSIGNVFFCPKYITLFSFCLHTFSSYCSLYLDCLLSQVPFKTQLKSHLPSEAFLIIYRSRIYSIEDYGAVLSGFRLGLTFSWYSLVQPCQVLKHWNISILVGKQFAAMSPSIVPLRAYQTSPGSEGQSWVQHWASRTMALGLWPHPFWLYSTEYA